MILLTSFWRSTLMKKYVFAIVAITVSLALVWSAFGQPAASGGGGDRGAGGGGMGGMGGGMGGMGGMRGGPVERPAKADRLKSVAELTKQITALKAAIDKAPDKDPNIAKLEGDARTKFVEQYTTESEAINAIQQTLSTMRPAGGGRGGLTTELISELLGLAKQDKASKLTARLEALAKEAQTSAARGGRGGGTGGRGRFTPPEGGFKYND
jgi:hypothetical protein